MPAADLTPIGDKEADALFARLAKASLVVVAVSGGKDSLALLHLLDRWRRRPRRPKIHVATVDHGLRKGSRDEAESVIAEARRRGLAATLLPWEGPKPRTGIEAAARKARYRFLYELARDLGASHVLTAHHRDDQAETVLMRLGRGSGLTGLAGMRAERPLAAGIVLFRPLLGIPSSRLAATAAAAGLIPAEDESNRDPRFARARLRQAMPALAAEGLTPEGLARTATRLARADAALDRYATELLGRAAVADDKAAIVNRDALLAAPEEVQSRAMARLIADIGRAERPPRSERLDAVLAAVKVGRAFRRTLGGAVVTLRDGAITLAKEPPRRRALTAAAARTHPTGQPPQP